MKDLVFDTGSVGTVLLGGFTPKIQTGHDVLTAIVFVSIQDLRMVSVSVKILRSIGILSSLGISRRIARHTSLVLECSILMFLAVMICTNALVSKCLISMKLGSNASRYGWLRANVFGLPSQSIFQSGLARHPFLFTKNENSL